VGVLPGGVLWEEAQSRPPVERFAFLDRFVSRPSTSVATEALLGAHSLRRVGPDTGFQRAAFLLDVAGAAGADQARASLVRTLLEFVRSHFGFASPIPDGGTEKQASFVDLLLTNRAHLTSVGLLRILAYLSRLDHGGTADALFLLTHDELWAALDDVGRMELASVRASRDSGPIRWILPWTTCARSIWSARRNISGCDVCCDRTLLPVPSQLSARRRMFRSRLGGSGHYASMCRHQLAFIRFLDLSDYRGALELLEPECAFGETGRKIGLLVCCTAPAWRNWGSSSAPKWSWPNRRSTSESGACA